MYFIFLRGVYMKFRFLFLVVVFLIPSGVFANATFNSLLNSQMGNGASFSCEACHTDGGSLASATLPMALTAKAGLNMALEDSDGDSFSNISEFLNGTGGPVSTNLDFNNPLVTPFTVALNAEGSSSTKVVVVGGGVATEAAIVDPYAQALVSVGAGNEIVSSVAVTVTALPATLWFPKAIVDPYAIAHDVVLDGLTPPIDVTADMVVDAYGSVSINAGGVALPGGIFMFENSIPPVIQPDISVTSISVGGGVYSPYDFVSVPTVFQNIGNLSSLYYNIVNYYISVDNIIDATDVLLKSFYLPPMAIGEVVSYPSNSIILPPLADGNYYIGAVIATLAGGEANTANNTAFDAVPITVVNPVPDASVFEINAVDGVYSSGDTMLIPYTVKNVGSDVFSAGYNINIYASLDTVIDGTDILLQSSVGPALSAGASDIYLSNSVVLPTMLDGNYYIGAVITPLAGETNTVNNTAFDAVPINILNTIPDVSLLGINALDGVYNFNDTIVFPFTVSNVGTKILPSAYSVSVYISTDMVIDAADTLLTVVPGTALAPGVIDSFVNVSATIPSLTGGGYYIGAVITPLAGETNTVNNTAFDAVPITVNPAVIDASVSGVSIASGPHETGSVINVPFTVDNVGSGDFPVSYTADIYISSDMIIDSNDVLLSSYSGSALISGGSEVNTGVSVTIPTNMNYGSYYIGVVVRALPGETVVSNNTAFDTVPITVFTKDSNGWTSCLYGGKSLPMFAVLMIAALAFRRKGVFKSL